MDEVINNLINNSNKTVEDNLNTLQMFIEIASEKFNFSELNSDNKRVKLWNALFELVNKYENNQQIIINCLSCIRILSRDKTNLNELVTDNWFQFIKNQSGYCDNFYINKNNELIIVEALKSLCNLIFNSSIVAALMSKIDVLEKILQRINKYNEAHIPWNIKYFDMKIVFLLTALCPEIRYKVKQLIYDSLITIMNKMLKDITENITKNDLDLIQDKQFDYLCEILKTFFNITLNLDNDENDLIEINNLINLLKNYLLISFKNKEKDFLLKNNIINLLTNIPSKNLIFLVKPIDENQKLSKKFIYDKQNMIVYYEILKFLKDRFNTNSNATKQHEILSPAITVLLKSAQNHRIIRKYLRLQVLPPLKDVRNRPEQGDTLRNHFCRLLTTPATQLRDLVAEFLFILCKKNVSRMIKYTGYGNAAGLFAQRGLLTVNSQTNKNVQDEDLVSSEEDSETEEYAQYKDDINPVIGCYEPPHQNIFENMSEEQKEYEAMKLVELIDNLTKSGIIKPCKIGDDGKPHPIEHLLELQVSLKDQHNNSDSE